MATTDDTPTKLVRARIHATLTRAHATHEHAAKTAAAAYAVPVVPPVQGAPSPVSTGHAGGTT